MFSFASNKLRASKHGNFSSIDSWSSSERMFAKDGYIERWYQASECTYSTVVEMNHPETQLNDKTDFKSPVYGRRVIRSLLITFSSTMTVPHGSQRHPWPQCGFYVYYSSLLEVTFTSILTLYLKKSSFFHNQFKTPTVISDAPFLEFDQSINQCSEPHFVV